MAFKGYTVGYIMQEKEKKATKQIKSKQTNKTPEVHVTAQLQWSDVA